MQYYCAVAIFAVGLTLVSIMPTNAQNAYVCEGKQKVGFISDHDDLYWRGNIFSSGRRFTLQKTRSDPLEWTFQEIDGYAVVSCGPGDVVDDLFRCVHGIEPYQLIFRPSSHRFQLYHEGYFYNTNNKTHDPDDGSEPFIEIGYCEAK